MRTSARYLLVATLSVGALTASATGAFADHGDRDGFRAASYINGDAGVNADVDPNSSCFNPDQNDRQRFSDAASGNPGNRNVHNDACFLDDRGNKVGMNIGASFQSRGTGYISACPDPDGAGPAVSRLRDLNGDGRNDSCFQSSYQDRGIAGDDEYHARLNNTGMAGDQDVRWGRDNDGDGRIDDRNSDSITVSWSADGTSGGGFNYGGR